MMVAIGIIVCWALGFSIINLMGIKLTKVELLGLSFLVGIAAQTMLMLLLDAAYIDLSASSTLATAVGAIVALNYRNIVKKRNPLAQFYGIARWRINLKALNIVWLLAMVLICYVEYMNWSKTLYFPPFDRDSLAGFETIGYVIGQEGRLQGLSLFDAQYIPSIHNAGSYITYAPMVQLSYGWVYILGAQTSKIIPALIYLAFLLSLYGSVRRVSNDMVGALTVAFVLISPEMLAFASLSTTNIIHAVYASLGVIYSLQWFKTRDRGELLLGATLLACNVWVRSEGVVFLGAVGLLMLLDAIRHRRWRPLLTMAAIAVAPMVVWAIFQAIFSLTSQSVIILHPFWDAEKASKIFHYMGQLLISTDYYGFGFYAALLALMASIYHIIARRDGYRMPVVIVVGIILYCVMLYQIDYKWDSIDNVLSYSAKRFLFCFVALLWYYTFTCPPAAHLLGRLNHYLSLN